jgi:glycosyltransferase involved in cell wall biosynthesis
MKVCHLTSVHAWTDTRILYRECKSLADAGFDVHLVAVNAVSAVVDGVTVHSVPATSVSRIYRATVLSFKVLRKALKIKADVYHFHDPELIWVGAILKLLGKKVVFDVHENIRQQILDKDWLLFRGLISRLYFLADWIAAKLFPLILAEDSYLDYYRRLGGICVLVRNFPDTIALSQYGNFQRSGNGILYIGGISGIRGIFTMVDALAILKSQGDEFHFHCIGPIPDDLRKSIEEYPNFRKIQSQVTFYNRLPVHESYQIAFGCKIGLSILAPVGNYLHSYSTKVFEYMTVGLPVIVSNFPLYDFIEQSKSGFLVDPEQPEQLAEVISRLLHNDSLAKQMGLNGYNYVKEHFAWESEKIKLLAFYRNLKKN